MKPYFKILTLSFLIILSNIIYPQPSASFYVSAVFPVNEYGVFDNEDGWGSSLEIFIFSPSKQKPVGLGFSFSFIGQGWYTYYDPYNDEYIWTDNRANNFINGHLILQLAPTGGTVRPYIETLFGGSYIFSESEFVDFNYTTFNLYYDDWAWSYGAGGGIKFLLTSDENGNGSLWLDLKGRYLMSSDVSIIDRHSIRYANNSFYYDVQEIQINFVTVQVGLMLCF